MAKPDKTHHTNQQNQQSPKMMVRVELVSIIAVACLLIGAIIGNQTAGGGRIVVDAQDHSAHASMPSEAEINHLIQQISSSNNYEALVAMGNQAMDQHITAVAVAAYEKALSIIPDDPNVITDLGAVYNDQMQQPQKALELFKQASKLDAKHVQSRYNTGIAYLHLNDVKSAEAAFDEVIKVAPNSDQAEQARQQLKRLKDQR